MTYNKYKGFKMNSLLALRCICYECEKNMAINKTRCPFRSISNEHCDDYELIKKDLEMANMLKNNISIQTDYDDETCKEYEYLTYNDLYLDIKNEEEYNKIKDWILK